VSNLIIKEEDKWEVEAAIIEVIKQALKIGIITKEDLERIIYG
jgi:hypothetical protein